MYGFSALRNNFLLGKYAPGERIFGGGGAYLRETPVISIDASVDVKSVPVQSILI